MQVKLLGRDQRYLTVYEGLQWTVERCSWHVVGGAKTALLTVAGDELTLWRLLLALRYGVELYADGLPTWWGYISRVTVGDGEIEVTADLDAMSNRVRVAYTQVLAGRVGSGPRGTTEWSEEAESIEVYGTKELLLTESDIDAVSAAVAAVRKLGEVGWPVGGSSAGLGERGELRATVECRGWWHTLGWRYAETPVGVAAQYDTLGSKWVELGRTTACEQAAQEVVLSSDAHIEEVQVHLQRVGALTRDIRVGIWSAVDGLPGEELAGQDIYGPLISTGGGWYWLAFGSTLNLSSGHYFLVIDGGEVSDSDYVLLQTDDSGGYGAGVSLRLNEDVWTAAVEDIPFRLFDNALVETTQQITALIVNYGQFLKRVVVDDASGIATESYRDGDSTARMEVESLLLIGTSTEQRRLFARVERDRSVVIYEAPEMPDLPMRVDRQGRLWDGNVKVTDGRAVGRWAMPGFLPNLGGARIGNLGAYVIEEVEWDEGIGKLSIRAMGERDVFDFGVRDG